MNDENLKYKSEIYYNVVIKNKPYKGYKCNYVGMGKMIFIHHKLPDITFDKGTSKDWMRECWEEFISKIEK
jgi:hypothetical protein